jgi:serine/threonine protein kinase
MNCPSENTLLELLEGGNEDPGRKEVEEHLVSCESCRVLVADARGEASRTDSESTSEPDGTVNHRPSGRRSRISGSHDALIGRRIGEYEVLEQIGSGGMGVVYRGVQPVIGKTVAIKVIRGEVNDDTRRIQRMLLEARAVNAIGHRGIVDIFGFGQMPGGRHYVVMEFLQGEPLDVWLRSRKPLSLTEVLDLLEEILAPLGAAHAAGVVHRDLKPSNLFRVLHGDGSRSLKLLDFGLAKRTMHDKGLTRTGLVLGTPGYMAPEQVNGEPVDARTDLYSLGVLAYRLAGTRPFDVTETVDLMEAHLRTPPRPIRQKRPDLPEALEALLLRLLEKDPARRPGSVEEVREALARIRPARTEPSMPALEVVPTPRAQLLRWAPLGAAGLVLAAAAVWSATRQVPPVAEPAPPLARLEPQPEPAQEPPAPPSPEPVAVAPEPPPPVVTAQTRTPARTSRSVTRPPPPTLDDERRQLLERIAAARAKLGAQGGAPDPLSSMFLDKAEKDAREAQTKAGLRQAERTIKGVEQKFLPPSR